MHSLNILFVLLSYLDYPFLQITLGLKVVRLQRKEYKMIKKTKLMAEKKSRQLRKNI